MHAHEVLILNLRAQKQRPCSEWPRLRRNSGRNRYTRARRHYWTRARRLSVHLLQFTLARRQHAGVVAGERLTKRLMVNRKRYNSWALL